MIKNNADLKLVELAGLANAGTYIAMPFLSVYLLNKVKLAPWQTGTIVTVLLLAGRLLPTLTGTLGDRYGHKLNIGIGIIVRGLGFILLGTTSQFPVLLVSGTLIGLGGAFYSPSISTLLSQSATRNRSFVWLNFALNAGTVVGPLVGIWFSNMSARLPFLWGGIVMIGLGLMATVWLRNPPVHRSKPQPSTKSLIHAVSSRHFLIFNFAMILFWVDFAQLTISIPLRAFQVVGTQSLVGTINVANGVVGMIAAIMFKRLFDRYSPNLLLALGFIPMGIGFLLIPLFATGLWLLFCVLLFTLGETLVLPSSNLAIAEFAHSGKSGMYFGISRLSWAAGGSLGNFIGVIAAKHSNPLLPWTIYAAVAVMGFLAFMYLHIRGGRIKHSPSQQSLQGG